MEDGDGFKEVCAHFGAAMYFAQCLEHGIVNALLFVDLIPRTGGKWTSEEYDAYFEGHFEKTLGNLIKHLRSLAPLPESLETALHASKSKRAFLAHHFFRERNDAVQRGAFEDLVAELEETRSFFEQTDRLLEAFVAPLMANYGVTEEILSNTMRKNTIQGQGSW